MLSLIVFSTKKKCQNPYYDVQAYIISGPSIHNSPPKQHAHVKCPNSALMYIYLSLIHNKLILLMRGYLYPCSFKNYEFLPHTRLHNLYRDRRAPKNLYNILYSSKEK